MSKCKKPNVVHISIEGDVGVGKSTVMLEIKKMLEEKFHASVVLNEELLGEDSLAHESWMRRAIKRTVWILSE